LVLKRYSSWFEHGFWNTLEHAITRVADAFSTLILLWALSPEVFSKLALAQAYVAPMLFFFLTPETVLYRDFGEWKASGTRILGANLKALRIFAWSKIGIAFVLTLFVAWFFNIIDDHSTNVSGGDRFFAVLWAFGLALSPQISGADREFLRLNLNLKTLNVISLYQKFSLLGGTIVVALGISGRLDLLALVSWFSAISVAVFARHKSMKVLANMRLDETEERKFYDLPKISSVLISALKTFSLWTHLSGIVQNWVQNLDMFFIGVFDFPARLIGLYAAVIKISNFTLAFPMAFANLFSIWVGRGKIVDGVLDVDRKKREKEELVRLTLGLALANIVLMTVVYLIAPWALKLLSHGRWSELELKTMHDWLFWALLACWAMSFGWLFSSWLVLRKGAVAVFFRVYVPWVVIALVLASVSAFIGSKTWSLDLVVITRVGILGSFCILLLVMVVILLRKKRINKEIIQGVDS